jgi:alcohol dehydrogenase class IV
MALAALLSGIALANAGLGAVHGIAAPLGACIAAPHGAICAALLPHVIEANVRALRAEEAGRTEEAGAGRPGQAGSPGAAAGGGDALRRYAEAGRILGGGNRLCDAEAADACVDSLRRLVADLGIPSLGSFGLTHERIPQVAQLASRSNSMRYNPAKLTERDLIDVLSKTL